MVVTLITECERRYRPLHDFMTENQRPAKEAFPVRNAMWNGEG